MRKGDAQLRDVLVLRERETPSLSVCVLGRRSLVGVARGRGRQHPPQAQPLTEMCQAGTQVVFSKGAESDPASPNEETADLQFLARMKQISPSALWLHTFSFH